jgi:hypothetical protein
MIQTRHFHNTSAEFYRYSNLFGESFSLNKTNFSLLEKNTGSGQNSRPALRRN